MRWIARMNDMWRCPLRAPPLSSVSLSRNPALESSLSSLFLCVPRFAGLAALCESSAICGPAAPPLLWPYANLPYRLPRGSPAALPCCHAVSYGLSWLPYAPEQACLLYVQSVHRVHKMYSMYILYMKYRERETLLSILMLFIIML